MSAPGFLGLSLLLLIAAAVLLVLAWAGADEALMYASVVCSVAAGLLLPVAYAKSRADARRPLGRADEREPS